MSAGLVLLAAALLAWPSAEARRGARVRAVAGVPRRPAPSARAEPGPVPDAAPGVVRRLALPVAAGGAVALLVGGATGVLLGAGAGVLAARLLRRTADPGARGAGTGADLPVACDLLAVCLAAGAPVGAALAAVATALPGPTGEVLAVVAGRLRLGAGPLAAWAGTPAELAGLGRVLVRAGESGTQAAGALRVLAAETRQAARGDAEAAVRRAGVWVLAPLGACFLPAFVCLGIAPMVIGIAGQVFG
ncbi:type II secretion system F family protein [Geodermatophilus nigrescens]|uniref:type II secretion system F family protein n=1 Tax=Geodermatophilus nigrescens TaxID=1070870 RepID=UPI00093412D1|nr:type II secretion system F family protein [Geodermatophilus nigrescens]